MCTRECKKTPFGSSVYICKTGKTLCIECNSFRLDFETFKRKYNVFQFILNRKFRSVKWRKE